MGFPQMSGKELFFSFILWIVAGTICAYIAKKRGRRPQVWFFLGMVLGLLGMIILFLLPDKKREQQEALLANNNGMTPLSLANETVKRNEELDEAKQPSINTYPWYYISEEPKQYGPIDLLTLKRAWKQDKLTANAYVWTSGMDNWEKVCELPQVEEELNR